MVELITCRERGDLAGDALWSWKKAPCRFLPEIASSKTMKIYQNRQIETEFNVASNPEFLVEGTAVKDFLYPDRTVIGVENKKAEDLLRRVYAPIVEQDFPWNLEGPNPRTGREVPLLATNRNSVELIKHASNSFLAMKISYINAVVNLCDAVGADVKKVAEGMGSDHRIGPQFLNAGIGFGGFCFPKDLQAFIRIAEKSGPSGQGLFLLPDTAIWTGLTHTVWLEWPGTIGKAAGTQGSARARWQAYWEHNGNVKSAGSRYAKQGLRNARAQARV